jgi:hypothetical protein
VLCSASKLGEVAKAAAKLEGRGGAAGGLLAVAYWGAADAASVKV